MNVWSILDIAIVIIFTISAVWGLKKGLMRMFLGIMSFVVAGVAVFILTAPLTQTMMQTAVPDMVRGKIEPVIVSVFDRAKGTVTVEEALSNAGMPEFAIEFVEKNTDMAGLERNFVETLTNSATDGIVRIFCMLLIFIGVHILLSLIVFIAGRAMNGTMLGSFNRMLGATIGVANAMLMVYLLCAAVMLLSPVIDMSPVTDAIQKTFITKCFYNNNILMNIFC